MIDLGTGRPPSSLEAVGLSLDEMQLLIQILELNQQLPTVLMALGFYEDEDARRVAFDKARTSLKERGLLEGSEESPIVHIDLEDRLRALVRPHWVVAMRLYVGDTISRLCLAKGTNHVYSLVLRGPDSYLVREVGDADLAGSIIGALPLAGPLNVTGLSVPTEQLSAIFNAIGDPSATADQLTQAGASAQDAGIVARAMVQCDVRADIVGVVYGDAKTDVHPHNIALFDTRDGRMVITATIANDGTKFSTLRSGTVPQLKKALNELIAELPDREEFRPGSTG